MNKRIDFVVIWVDGNDPKWQEEYKRYSPISTEDKEFQVRYRDWNLLRYWFRGVEKFTPWVNRVHFVTCGQRPEWLNPNAPKLHCVEHKDYIPDAYLPTFSSHPIEINMHRIEGLEEMFVYFNDDFYIVNHLSPERFFKSGLPCDRASSAIFTPNEYLSAHHVITNNTFCINSHFNKRETMLRHLTKWFNIRYLPHPRGMWHNLISLTYPHFSKLGQTHLPQPYLKSTFFEVWRECEDILLTTSASRFREDNNVNQWLFRDWQIAKGEFYPYDVYRDSISFDISDSNIDTIQRTISRGEKSVVVLNDSSQFHSFNDISARLIDSFHSILPEKCSFEL